MGKGLVMFLAIIFDASALICWFLAASEMSVTYLGYGIVLFVIGMVLGIIGKSSPNQKSPPPPPPPPPPA